MRVLITIQHPAHVHFFRNAIGQLERDGHEVAVYTRHRPLIETLLDHYGIYHEPLATHTSGIVSLVRTQLAFEARLLSRARAFRPDVMTAVGEPAVPHVASLIGARSVIWTDSGDAAPLNRLGTPFADVVCTPRCLDADYGEKQRRYDGYHELAYLHPDRFEPDPEALRESGIDPDERYFVCRFVAWEASHDVGKSGLSARAKRRIIDYLDGQGTVYVTSEGVVPEDLQSYESTIPPQLIHDLLWSADLYIGDSQTMATEAAVLGTPAVRSNDFAGAGDMGNFVELEEYGLLVSTADEERAIDHVTRLAGDETATDRWRERRERLLAEKIDVTEFAVDVLTGEGQSSAAPTESRSPEWSTRRSDG